MKRRIIMIAIGALPLIGAASQSSINQGIRLLKKGKVEEATKILSEVKDVDPALAQYNLGNAYYQQGDFVKANAAYENAQHATDTKQSCNQDATKHYC